MKLFKHSRPFLAATAVLGMILLLQSTACDRTETSPVAPAAQSHEDSAKPRSNRIDIPPSVRQNLGITFVTVEKRPVHSTVRLPGQFEFRPEARREYHVMLPGRIELLVKQYERVEYGQPLFYLDSPEWQRMQSDLVVFLNTMKRSHADLAVAQAKMVEKEKAAAFVQKRLAKLADAKVRKVELEAELEDKRNMLPRLRAELDAVHTQFDAAHARYSVMLRTAASFTGIPIEELNPQGDAHQHLEGNQQPWQTIDRLTITAEAAGVVDRLAVTNQGWAETGDLVLDTIDPTALRFHADALQTDIALFADRQPGRIAPPPGGSLSLQDTAEGTITVGFQADSEQRTIPIFMVPDEFPSWAKAGVTAYLEVFTNGYGGACLAIPEAAVVRDGLERVFSRRDPANPNEVIRMAADLGASDGRWVEVKSGVMRGDEIVLGGVYPLMLASSQLGERAKGGHFHADGTFHASKEE